MNVRFGRWIRGSTRWILVDPVDPGGSGRSLGFERGITDRGVHRVVCEYCRELTLIIVCKILPQMEFQKTAKTFRLGL